MIHFDFTVSDEEAELIFDAIQDQINRADELRLFEPIVAEWAKNHIAYLEALKAKMKNTRV